MFRQCRQRVKHLPQRMRRRGTDFDESTQRVRQLRVATV